MFVGNFSSRKKLAATALAAEAAPVDAPTAFDAGILASLSDHTSQPLANPTEQSLSGGSGEERQSRKVATAIIGQDSSLLEFETNVVRLHLKESELEDDTAIEEKDDEVVSHQNTWGPSSHPHQPPQSPILQRSKSCPQDLLSLFDHQQPLHPSRAVQPHTNKDQLRVVKELPPTSNCKPLTIINVRVSCILIIIDLLKKQLESVTVGNQDNNIGKFNEPRAYSYVSR